MPQAGKKSGHGGKRTGAGRRPNDGEQMRAAISANIPDHLEKRFERVSDEFERMFPGMSAKKAELARRGFELQVERLEALLKGEQSSEPKTLRLLTTAPCGPWTEALDTSKSFHVGADVCEALGIKDTDVLVKAKGDSMVGADIPDGCLLVMRPLNGEVPPSGSVCLIQVQCNDGRCEATIKKWRNRKTDFALVDGGNREVWLPSDAIEMRAIAYMVAKMERAS